MYDLHISDSMNGTVTEIPVGPFTPNDAKARRQEWYSFGRSHITTIADAQLKLQMAIKNKDLNAQRNLKNRIEGLELQHETILNYEVSLNVDLETSSPLSHTLIFHNRAHRMAEFERALKPFENKPSIIDMVTELNDFSDPKAITIRPSAQRLAANPELASQVPDISEFLPSAGEGFDLARVLSPEALAAEPPLPSANEKPNAQLDTPSGVRHTDPVLPDSSTTNGDSSNDS